MPQLQLLTGQTPVSSDVTASALGTALCQQVTLALHISSSRPVVIVASSTQTIGLHLVSGMTLTLAISALSSVYVRASGLVTWVATVGLI